MLSWWQDAIPVRDLKGERPLLALRVGFGPGDEALEDRVSILFKAQKRGALLKGEVGRDFPSSFSTHPALYLLVGKGQACL